MKYKGIASDFDGTLARKDGSVCKENIEAISEFVSRGGKFALCTGRMTASAVIMLEDFPFNQLIAAYNGCEIWDNVEKKLIYSVSLSVADAVDITRFAKDMKASPFVYEGDSAYTDEDTPYSKFYADTCRIPVKAVGDVEKFIVERKILSPKAMIMVDPKRSAEVYSAARERFGDRFELAHSYEAMLDLTPKGSDKGAAISALAKIWGVREDEIAAFGDETNDMPMIEKAGLGVAMANAKDEVKKRARVVSEKDNENGGVAEIIRKYCLD